MVLTTYIQGNYFISFAIKIIYRQQPNNAFLFKTAHIPTMVVNLDVISHRLLEDSSQQDPQETDKSLSLFNLFLALLCPLSIVWLSYYLKLNIETKILVSVARTIIQLLLAGYVLLGFIFSMRNPIYVIAYLLLMVGIASIEVTSRQARTYVGHFMDSCISVFVGGAIVGAYGSIIVFHPSPWWEPHVMVRSYFA